MYILYIYIVYNIIIMVLQRWPVIEEENWEEEKAESKNFHFESDSERTSSDQPYIGDFCFVIGDDNVTEDELILAETTGKLLVV